MSYVLAGFRRRSRAVGEAALKYVIYGGVASGVMLYGMSLLYGLAGATSFPRSCSAARHDAVAGDGGARGRALPGRLRLQDRAVPFHMWCPDVYEGAPTPVTAFLVGRPQGGRLRPAPPLLARGVLPAELGRRGRRRGRCSSGSSPWRR